MTRHECHGHIVTVTVDPYAHYHAPTATYTEGLDYETAHPAACDALKYGELCDVDAFLNETGLEYSGIPGEPGAYAVTHWASGPDHNGEYDDGLAVDRHTPDPAPAPADPWGAIA